MSNGQVLFTLLFHEPITACWQSLGPKLQTCSYLMLSFKWPCWDTCEGIWGVVHAYLFGGECDRDKMMQL